VIGSGPLISHAPVGPWFSTSWDAGFNYLTVNSAVGSSIDWYNVQFYNQADYTSCTTLLTKSSNLPQSSLFEIIKNSKIAPNKLVIGKPLQGGDATNGLMSFSTFAGCLKQAEAKGWKAGVMLFKYHQGTAQSAIKTIKAAF